MERRSQQKSKCILVSYQKEAPFLEGLFFSWRNRLDAIQRRYGWIIQGGVSACRRRFESWRAPIPNLQSTGSHSGCSSMHFDAEIRRDVGPFDHAGEAGSRQGRAALRHEHKGRLNAFALVPAQLPQLATSQGMGCRGTVLDSADVQGEVRFSKSNSVIFSSKLRRAAGARIKRACIATFHSGFSAVSIDGIAQTCAALLGDESARHFDDALRQIPDWRASLARLRNLLQRRSVRGAICGCGGGLNGLRSWLRGRRAPDLARFNRLLAGDDNFLHRLRMGRRRGLLRMRPSRREKAAHTYQRRAKRMLRGSPPHR